MSTNEDDLTILEAARIKDALWAHPELGNAPAPQDAMQRWRRALDSAARPAPQSAAAAFGIRFATAAYAVVIAAIGIAFFAPRHADNTGVPGPDFPVVNARIERALQLHLADLESQLEQASELPVGERRSALHRLAEQNRMQAAVAERAGVGREARLLRAFTVALDEMTAGSAANGEFRGALAQLNFEMKVMQARLASASPTPGARPLQAL